MGHVGPLGRRGLTRGRDRGVAPPQPSGEIPRADEVRKRRVLPIAADVDLVAPGEDREVDRALPAGLLAGIQPGHQRPASSAGVIPVADGSVELEPIVVDAGDRVHAVGGGIAVDARDVDPGVGVQPVVERGHDDRSRVRGQSDDARVSDRCQRQVHLDPHGIGVRRIVGVADVAGLAVEQHGDTQSPVLVDRHLGIVVTRVGQHRVESVVARGDVGPGQPAVFGTVDPLEPHRGVVTAQVRGIADEVVNRAVRQAAAPIDGRPAESAVVAAEHSPGSEEEVCRRQKDTATSGDSGNVLSHQLGWRDLEPGRSTVGGAQEPGQAPAGRAEAAVAPRAGHERLVGRIGRVELERRDRQRGHVVDQRHPVRIGRRGVVGTPDAGIRSGQIQDVGVGGMGRPRVDRTDDRISRRHVLHLASEGGPGALRDPEHTGSRDAQLLE